MSQTATGPDGQLHVFPDEATPEMISQAFGLQPATPIGPGEGFMHGLMAPVNGLAQAGLHMMDGSGLGDMDPSKTLDQQLATQETQYKAGRQAAGVNGIDWPEIGGEMVATAPLAAVVPQTKAAQFGAALGKYGSKAASFLSNAAIDTTAGGGYGAVQPVTEGDYAPSKAEQIETSAGISGLLGPLTGMAAKAIKPSVSDETKILMNEGVSPTLGQILGGGAKWLEDKATSIPGLGYAINSARSRSLDQFNTAALNRALTPIGASTDKIGRQGLSEVSDKLSDAYDQVLPNLTLKLDNNFAQQISSARNAIPTSELPVFDSVLSKQFSKFSPNGEMSGDTLKGFQSEIRNHANGYGSDTSYDKQQVGQALDQVHAAIGDALQRTNPKYASQLANINQGYANYATLRRAGSMVKEDGPFTPQQLATAIRSNDSSVGKGNFARGRAMMQDLSDAGVGTLANKYPDSGTAGREGLMALLGGALLGHVNPAIPLGIGAAALPYTPITQKASASLLTQRPAGALQLAQALRKATPMLGNTGSIFASQESQ